MQVNTNFQLEFFLHLATITKTHSVGLETLERNFYGDTF